MTVSEGEKGLEDEERVTMRLTRLIPGFPWIFNL